MAIPYKQGYAAGLGAHELDYVVMKYFTCSFNALLLG